MCPRTTIIDLALQISARNFSQPFLPSSRCLASEPCVNGTSVLVETSPPSRDLHRLYTRAPSSRTAVIFPDQAPCLPPASTCRDVRPARVPDAQWRRLCRGKGRDYLQRLACADVAATRARLAGSGSWRKRDTAKGDQRVGGCRLREVRRGWCCGCLGDADEANRVHEIAILAHSYLLWGVLRRSDSQRGALWGTPRSRVRTSLGRIALRRVGLQM
jgi:hypothetical protein